MALAAIICVVIAVFNAGHLHELRDTSEILSGWEGEVEILAFMDLRVLSRRLRAAWWHQIRKLL